MTSSSFFLTFAPLFVLGLIVLLGAAALLWKSGALDTVKTVSGKVFGACVFYVVTVGLAIFLVGPFLGAINGVFWDLPIGTSERMAATPALYILAGLGSLFILAPDRWATGQAGSYFSYLLGGLFLALVGGYALGVFPPPSFWEAQSFLDLPPGVQAGFKWLWPPIYPGGC